MNSLVTAASYNGIINSLQGILNSVVPLVAGLALLYFIWGMVIFIAKSGEETARTEGKSKMIWGAVALFVMVSVWGLVGIISNSFGIGTGGTEQAPHF